MRLKAPKISSYCIHPSDPQYQYIKTVIPPPKSLHRGAEGLITASGGAFDVGDPETLVILSSVPIDLVHLVIFSSCQLIILSFVILFVCPVQSVEVSPASLTQPECSGPHLRRCMPGW
jgi:hypothetical protein